jgi:hypothetical protein
VCAWAILEPSFQLQHERCRNRTVTNAERQGNAWGHARVLLASRAVRPATLLVIAGVLLGSSRAEAYRPFDGTDADVAELGSFELELGPAHWYYQSGQESLRGHYLIAPATVLNFGIFKDTELVVDFEDFVALGPLNGRPNAALLNTDVLVKHVFREGILQGKTGLSIAVEAGPLTPEINGTNAFGASVNALFSYRWDWGTVHFNEWPSYTREHNLDLYSGVIVEGPHEWVVRPVTELYVEKEFNGDLTESALIGAIWTLRESFVLDLGVRGARIDDDCAAEVRLGFTWSLPMWVPTENAAAQTARRD